MPTTVEESHATGVDSDGRAAVRWPLVLALAALAILSLIWVTWAEIRAQERQRAMDAAARRQVNLSIAVSQYVSRTLKSADAVAHYLTGLHVSAPHTLPEQLAARAQANSPVFDLILCQDGGAVLTAGALPKSPRQLEWCESWLPKTHHTAKSLPADPITASGITYVPLLTRLPAAATSPAGVLALLVDVPSLLGLMQEYRIPDETVVLVANSQGKVRARWDNVTGTMNQQAPEAALLPTVLASGTPGQQHEIEGKPVLVHARRVLGHDLVVMIVTSVGDTLAEPNKRLRYYGLVATVFSFMIVLFAMLLLWLHTRVLQTAVLRANARGAEERASWHRAQSTFLAGISHDFRTPLASIVTAASSLQTQWQKLTQQDQWNLATVVLTEAAHLTVITENTLQLARLENLGQIEKDWQSVEEIVGSVLARVRKRDGQQRIQADVPANLPLIRADGVLLGQLLENLLDNALKYTDGVVELVTEHVGNSIEISVLDRGPGIASEDEKSLFVPFRRTGRSGRRGAGLGLAVCQAIANAHGSELQVSKRKGGGTSFSLRLSVGAAPASH